MRPKAQKRKQTMISRFFKENKEFGMVAGMLLILGILFAPIPTALLDFAILMNLGFALTILMMTFYVAKPVDFSTFPSLLLIATLFRLSLNVAATRLILTGGDAGAVINSIGAFSVSGNFVVGLVVFFILVVVQYVVVTSGAQRVSEVAARFMLDSMPGQQMSVDADLNMGLIDQKEAIRRRAELEKEASFYGAMDGASKFVKGDAIAGVIILLINIIAGCIIGVTQMGMPWGEALQRFTLLTIGDGIATQLPALIIAIATGIIITRSSEDGDLGSEVFKQLSAAPRILFIVCGVLSFLLILPGMPKWPIAILIGLMAALWWYNRSSSQLRSGSDVGDGIGDDAKAATTKFEPLTIALGPNLGKAWIESQAILMDRITTLRQTQEAALGMGFPPVSLVDGPLLGQREYEVRVLGTRHAGAIIEFDQMLAIKSSASQSVLSGREVLDPAFGLPAVWINQDQVRSAREDGYTIIDPITVFITHLGEIMRVEAPTLLMRGSVSKLLEEVRSRQPGLIEELVPTLMTVSDVQRVLQNLLSENVTIANIDIICEHLVDLARTEKEPGALTELVRQRMGNVICSKLCGRNRDLAVLSLDPRVENQIQASVASSNKKEGLTIEPRMAEQLVRKLVALAGDMQRNGREPVLLCGGEIRRQLKSVTRRSIPRLSVISVSEIPGNIDLSSAGIVRLDQDDASPRQEPPKARDSFTGSQSGGTQPQGSGLSLGALNLKGQEG
jgi:flagellar biosynthesis protein FlhA